MVKPAQAIRQSKQRRSWPASQVCRRGCRAAVADVPVIQHCVGVARAPRQIEAPDGAIRRRAEGPGPGYAPDTNVLFGSTVQMCCLTI
jgi:hypothetical protein